jgi:membrane-associated progesterone receptor component
MGLSLDFGTPVNTALLVYILYSVKRIIFPSTPTTVPNEFKAGYSWMPKTHPPTVLFRTFTPQTLEPFSGKDGSRILLAINGIVFDVTAGRNFYGPSAYYLPSVTQKVHAVTNCERIDGMYGNFAGRDASRGMAKQSFDLGPFSLLLLIFLPCCS